MERGFVDQRGYLKTPRIFGFHGVYKRLAVHAGLVDVHFGPCAGGEELVDPWARGAGYAGREGCRALLDRWARAVERSLGQRPPRTATGWDGDAWSDLARHIAPQHAKAREKRFLRDRLHASDAHALGALPQIWALQEEFGDDYSDETLHRRLERVAPQYAVLLAAIRAYEAFCRSLQNAFDTLRVEAQKVDACGYAVTKIGGNEDFARAVLGLEQRYEVARQQLAEVDLQLTNLFDQQFAAFAEPMAAADCATAICAHRENETWRSWQACLHDVPETSVKRCRTGAGTRTNPKANPHYLLRIADY